MSMDAAIRLFRLDQDLPRFAGLINALNGSHHTDEQVLSRISWAGHDLARDRWVAEEDGQLVGQCWVYAQSPARCFMQVSVHPERRRQGWGRRLLAEVLRAARLRGAAQVTTTVPAKDSGAQRFLAQAGFALAGQVRFFSAPDGLLLSPPQLPPGYRMASGDTFPLQTFADACNRCYADLWGHYENLQPLTVEKIEEWRSRAPERFRLDGIFVIFGPQDDPVGVTRAMLEGEEPDLKRVIDAPGVAPEYRPLGLQRALVQAAAGWLRQNAPAGVYEIQTWGDTQEAVDLYNALGFRLDEESHELEFVYSLA